MTPLPAPEALFPSGRSNHLRSGKNQVLFVSISVHLPLNFS
jgi:hypothetical protein